MRLSALSQNGPHRVSHIVGVDVIPGGASPFFMAHAIMTFHIQLTTRDQQQLQFDCEPEQSLIDAADATHITLPSQCRQGSCGACHAHVSWGNYRLGEHNPDALPADSKNAILMCRTTPISDLTIELPYDHRKILFHEIPQRSAEIVVIEPIAENTVRLQLRLNADAEGCCAAEFEPGQFMELDIPEHNVRRAYSLANTSNWDGLLEFFIRLQPHGQFSTFLKERARVGQTITVRGAQGAFGIESNSLRARWFVAGGTGLAPMLSMLRRMAEFGEMQDARLFFGVNKESELFARQELEELRAQLPQLKIDICVWRPQNKWDGFVGTPADAIREALKDIPEQPDMYLCGPPPLINAVEKAALEFGVPAERIFSERFLPA